MPILLLNTNCVYCKRIIFYNYLGTMNNDELMSMMTTWHNDRMTKNMGAPVEYLQTLSTNSESLGYLITFLIILN